MSYKGPNNYRFYTTGDGGGPPSETVADHEAKPNPHPQYLLTVDLPDSDPAGTAAGLLADHLADPDPHAQYAKELDLATVAFSGDYEDLLNLPTGLEVKISEDPGNSLILGSDDGVFVPTLTADSLGIKAILGVTFDGGDTALVIGAQCDLYVPYELELKSYSILGDRIGHAVIQIWATDYVNYPPTNLNDLGGVSPYLFDTDKNSDNVLSGWTKTIDAGTTLRFNIANTLELHRVTLTLVGVRK